MEYQFPQGIEVLVKKASVDSYFAESLRANRAGAAAEIGLELTEAEAAILAAVPDAQLESIIAQTTVSQEHRRVFLGKAAVAMLAALGVTGVAAAGIPVIKGGGCGGIRPEPNFGVRPPPQPEEPVEEPPPPIEPKVIALVAKHMATAEADISRETRFTQDLKPNEKQREAMRKALEKEFDIPLPAKVFAKIKTIGDTCDYVKVTGAVQPLVLQAVGWTFSISKLTRETSLEKQIKEDGQKLSHLRTKLAGKFRIQLAWDEFKKVRTAGEVIGMTGYALRKRATPEGKKQTPLVPTTPSISRGIDADRFPAVVIGSR
jgi:acyl carrier protein